MILLRGIRQVILGVAACTLIAACASGPMPVYESRDQPVSAQDLEILDRTGSMLGSESAWNRKETRECHPGAPTLSLFCALNKASIELLGSYDQRRAALQEVRFAIEEVSGGREFEHRLRDFNNLPETTLGDIQQVLAIARGKVAERLKAAPGTSFKSTPPGGAA